MSENNDYLRTGSDPAFRLRADVLSLMLKGASYAAILCLAVWFVLWAIFAVGKMLPDESRETEDPTPFSYDLSAPQAYLA